MQNLYIEFRNNKSNFAQLYIIRTKMLQTVNDECQILLVGVLFLPPFVCLFVSRITKQVKVISYYVPWA